MPTHYYAWGDAVTAVPAQVISQEDLNNIYTRLNAVEYNRYAVDYDLIRRDELFAILDDFKQRVFTELQDRIHILSAPDITLVFDQEE